MKTKMNKPWVWAMAGFVVLAVLHQDSWNWDDGNLVFGIMPVGLAYHAAYSVVVALFWAGVIKFAWPGRLEAWANEGDAEASVESNHETPDAR